MSKSVMLFQVPFLFNVSTPSFKEIICGQIGIGQFRAG
jgi:hypothetical protein